MVSFERRGGREAWAGFDLAVEATVVEPVDVGEGREYVDWVSYQRLHGEITDDASYSTPAEREALYYRQNRQALEAATQ